MTTLSQLRQANGNGTVANPEDVKASFDTANGFAALQRMGNLFAHSDLVPAQFKGNLPNCTIAVDMAMRLGANPLLVMQNLFVIENKPAWSSQFLIATFNASGKYTSIRYEFVGKEGTDEWGCRAVATELKTNEKLAGPLISIKLARENGWFRNAKWKTMPEQMLRYRAAAWFIRTIAPEIALGLSTVEEVRETIELEQTDSGSYAAAPAPEENPMDKVAAHVEAAPARKRTRKAKTEEVPVAPAPAPAPEVVEAVEEVQGVPAEEVAPAQPVQEAQQEPQVVRDDLDIPELVALFHKNCVDAKLPGQSMVVCFQTTVSNVPADEAKAAMAYDPALFGRIAEMVRANPTKYQPADW